VGTYGEYKHDGDDDDEPRTVDDNPGWSSTNEPNDANNQTPTSLALTFPSFTPYHTQSYAYPPTPKEV
jgi:hypothetical protein